NGATPTTNSAFYSGPVLLQGDTTLQALGVAATYANSDVQTVFYGLLKTATPVFSPSARSISNGTRVSVSCDTPGAAIYYTLDGTSPTTNSALYSGPIMLQPPVTLQAVSFRSDLNLSSIAVGDYNLAVFDHTVVTTFASGFSSPRGVCLDQAGNLYV